MSVPEYMVPARPLGISILSVLHFLGGVLLVALGAAFPFIASKQPNIAEALATIGIPLPLLVAGILFLAVLGIASGVGMWIGAKWGWYIGSFYYMYSVIRCIFAILNVYLLFDQLPAEEVAAMSRGPGYHYVKFGGRAIVHSLIFLYFFKGNVVDYFGIKDANAWKILLIEFGISIGIALAASFWSAMSL